MSFEESTGEENSMPSTPPDLREEADQALNDLLPSKSKERYINAYENFMRWRKNKKANNFSENLFLAYFKELAQTRKSSTLWSFYSMIRATMQLKHNVDLRNYTKLVAWLKQQADGYTAKKSEVFTSENIQMFLDQAPDKIYLATKVVLILGIQGACRGIELTNITTNNIEFHGNTVIVKLRDTINKTKRSFVLREQDTAIVKKYFSMRPKNMMTDRFFLNYRNGKCTRQVIGRHKILAMPKQIAKFLNLANPQLYTGNCFRLTSASLLENSKGRKVPKSQNKSSAEDDDEGVKDRRNLQSEDTAMSRKDHNTSVSHQQHHQSQINLREAPLPGPSKITCAKTINPNVSKPDLRGSKLCRFCGQFNEECSPISPNFLADDKTTLAFNNISIQLEFSNDSPNTVCKDCDIKLQIMYDFVKVVETAQVSLKNGQIDIEDAVEEDTKFEMITLKPEYEGDSDEYDDSCDDNDNDDSDDNDTKEGILDSFTVDETIFIKETVQKRKSNNLSQEKPKKIKTEVDYKNMEFMIDIKQEVIDSYDINVDANTGISDKITEVLSEEHIKSETDKMISDENS